MSWCLLGYLLLHKKLPQNSRGIKQLFYYTSWFGRSGILEDVLAVLLYVGMVFSWWMDRSGGSEMASLPSQAPWWGWLVRRVSSPETVDQRASTCPFRQCVSRVVGFLPWQLRIPREGKSLQSSLILVSLLIYVFLYIRGVYSLILLILRLSHCWSFGVPLSWILWPSDTTLLFYFV